jgi:hypothetical protein
MQVGKGKVDGDETSMVGERKAVIARSELHRAQGDEGGKIREREKGYERRENWVSYETVNMIVHR